MSNGGIWDPTAAFADSNLNLPDVTGGTSSSSSATPSSGNSTSSGANKSNNAGAIAGGVVGGVVFLALLGLGLFFLLRYRKNARDPPSAQFSKPQRNHERLDLVGDMKTPFSQPPASGYTDMQTPPLPNQGARLYVGPASRPSFSQLKLCRTRPTRPRSPPLLRSPRPLPRPATAARHHHHLLRVFYRPRTILMGAPFRVRRTPSCLPHMAFPRLQGKDPGIPVLLKCEND